MRRAFETDAWPATPGRLGGTSRLFLAMAAIESADEHLDAWLQAQGPPHQETHEDPVAATRGGDLRAVVECLRTAYLDPAVEGLLLSLANSRLGEDRPAESLADSQPWEEAGDEAAARMKRMVRRHRWSWNDDGEGGEEEA